MSLRDYLLLQARQANAERSSSGLNPEKMKDLHNKIESGEIPVGPFPDHTMATQDLRPKYDGEQAWIIHKAGSNGHGDIDLSKLR